MPLKGIPRILSPDLLYVLASMGHGDELILADAHFPTSSLCRFGPKEIRADGNMSRATRKPTVRLRQAWIQMSLRIRTVSSGSMLFTVRPYKCSRSFKGTVWILMRLSGCAGLVANALCWFYRGAAHICFTNIMVLLLSWMTLIISLYNFICNVESIPIPKLLEAILTLMPLDTYVSHPVCLMDKVPEDKAKGLQTPIWTEYQVVIDNIECTQINIEKLERFKFYERAKRAFAIVHTGEVAQYGNIILKKGVAL